MFLIYRVLNNLDIEYNPLFNGLASKKMIYDMTLSYLKSKDNNYFNSLSKEEKDMYIKENMINYVKTHQYKIKKKIDNQCIKNQESLSKLEFLNQESWVKLLCTLSTLNTHLSNGSKINTDWISATKDFNSIYKYYSQQDIHKVALLKSNSNGIVDENTLVVDLSKKSTIKDILPLISKKLNESDITKILNRAASNFNCDIFYSDILKPTSENFTGFKYASFDKEVCIYRCLPPLNVVAILETLQMELIALKMFNFEFLKLDKNKQVEELRHLKEMLKRKIVELNDCYILHIFEELYLKNKNIKDVKDNLYDDSKIKYAKLKILKLAKEITNIQIKR